MYHDANIIIIFSMILLKWFALSLDKCTFFYYLHIIVLVWYHYQNPLICVQL